MRHNKKRKEQPENVPEIFKDLWGFNFVEEISCSKVKNEMWPNIRVVIAREDENKTKMIKNLFLKYEIPFSNLNIISSANKNEREAYKEKPGISQKNIVFGKNKKPIFKVNGSSDRFKFKAR